MRQFLFLILVLSILIIIAGTVSAQQATPEPMPTPATVVQGNSADMIVSGQDTVTVVSNDNPALVIALGVLAFIVVVLVGVMTLDRHKLAEEARKIIPPEVLSELLSHRGQINSAVDQGFDTIDQAALVTSSPIDDLLSRYGREGLHKIIDGFADAMDGQTVAAPEAPAPAPSTVSVDVDISTPVAAAT